MRRSVKAVLVAGWLSTSVPLGMAQTPAPAITSPSSSDLAAMLADAQRFTVKVRGSVAWPFSPEMAGSGQGTGFIVDRAKGLILTNAHVARRSPSVVEVAFGETETEWKSAEKVYVDNFLDVAVLKVATEKLPADASAAKLGCTEAIRQGASVVAYGHPISLSFTATRGIISSVRTLGNREFVQMDANINPGNSGGPLLGVDAAAVIGINTANFPGAPGLGLAVSIRHVCPILDLLARNQDPSVPLLPVYWLKQGRNETLTVAAPFPSARAAGAADGLLAADVVTGVVGGPKLASIPDLHTALRGRTGTVTLSIQRGAAARDVTMPLLAPRSPLVRTAVTVAGMMISARQNAFDLPDLGLPPLRVDFVKPSEAAQRAGFMLGDMLEAVGGQRFDTAEALFDWLKT